LKKNDWNEIYWNEIDTVFLDMDGTLLDLHYDNTLWNVLVPRHYAEARAIDEEQARAVLFSHMSAVRSTIEFYCLDYWANFSQLDVKALHEEPAHLLDYRGGAREFLGWLHRCGKQRVLVTNAHRDSLAVKDAHTGLTKRLDAVFSSHDFGHPKEDDAFWRAFALAHGFDPTRSLMIDDNENVLEAAGRAGVAHLLIVSQPDSNRPTRDGLAFPAFNHFDEIMPDAYNGSAHD
jgi:putative hydrolase of the HAD superfamily|tara:strand:+ start:1226 stop:1924 length:699 start_codon:yes stop_codon:yes gene_type:complete